MNNQLQIFNYNSKQVRTIIKDNELWFVAKDVCEILEINPSEAVKGRKDRNFEDGLDVDEYRDDIDIVDSIGRRQKALAVNEAGLYSLILKSRKPEAKQFKRWITHEVIPSIRKYGLYATLDTVEKILENPDYMIEILQKYKEEKQKRLEAENRLKEQEPLVLFADTCLKSKDNILVRELAKIAKDEGIEIGEKRLYNKLRSWKIIMPNSTEPYQQYVDKGYFVVEEKPIDTPYGVKLTRTTKVTPKGQVYIIERLKKEFQKHVVAV